MKKMGWSTQDEISFIVGLGHFADPSRTTAHHERMPGRTEMLRRYLAGARLRGNWEDMDRNRILATARTHLAHAEAHERAV